MKRQFLLLSLLLLISASGVAAQSAQRLLGGEWVVAEINRWGEIVPASCAPGDYFGFDFDRRGRVVYESTVRRGVSFSLEGDWRYFPGDRTLVIDYYRKRTNENPRYGRRFRPATRTYYVERLNRQELILRDRNGGRDFVLMAMGR